MHVKADEEMCSRSEETGRDVAILSRPDRSLTIVIDLERLLTISFCRLHTNHVTIVRCRLRES